MNRLTIFACGTPGYVTLLATYLCAVPFIGKFALSKSMDSPADSGWPTAMLIDLGLLSLFALQHSIMAFFALTTTVHILVAIQFEERDLMAKRPEYIDHRPQVPMIVPGSRRHDVISKPAQSSDRRVCGPFGDFDWV